MGIITFYSFKSGKVASEIPRRGNCFVEKSHFKNFGLHVLHENGSDPYMQGEF